MTHFNAVEELEENIAFVSDHTNNNMFQNVA